MNSKQKFLLWSQALDLGGRFLMLLPKWGTFTALGYFAFRALAMLAGKQTLAQFGLFLIADLKTTKAFSHLVTGLFGVGGVSYGVRERSLRRKTVKRITSRVKGLEEQLDPDRSSSHLTEVGTTRKEDIQ